jgi:hypothetical protein
VARVGKRQVSDWIDGLLIRQVSDILGRRLFNRERQHG